MGIRELDPKNKFDIKSVSSLHRILIPDSPVVIFGPAFMEFYYSKLLEDGMLYCDLYDYNGEIAGFISYSKNSSSFFRLGLNAYFLNLIFLIGLSIIQKPSRITGILKTLRLKNFMNKMNVSEGTICSFGILPKYRNRNFIRKTGIRISHDLFDRAVQFFRDQNFQKINILVLPDNKETLLFYHSVGCKLQKIMLLGKNFIKVTYELGLDYNQPTVQQVNKLTTQ